VTKGNSQTSPSPAAHRAEHVFRLVERLRLSWLLAHLPPTAVWASYVLVNSFATIGLLAGLAFVTHNPFVFPSLGPTAYLFFSLRLRKQRVPAMPFWVTP
jgi:CBS domain-containing membrane protein